MKLGIGTSLARTQGHPDADKDMDAWSAEVEFLLWQVRVAEEGGFESLWLTEHHFSYAASMGAPSVFLAHIAAMTRRIRIGYGIALVPMYQPVRLAEEMLWVDQLSRGRLNIGLGRGHVALEFAALGVPAEQSRARMDEGLQIILPALRGEPVEFHGEVFDVPYVRLYPGPYQKPHPPLYMVATSDASMRLCAEVGATPILGVDAVERLAAQVRQFREFCAEVGRTEEETEVLAERIKCSRRLVVSRDRAAAEEEARRGQAELDRSWATGLLPVGDRSRFDPWSPRTAADYDTPEYAQFPGHEMGHVFLGTPEEVVEQIRDLEARTGIHHMTTNIATAGVHRAFAQESARLLVEEVLPRLAD